MFCNTTHALRNALNSQRFGGVRTQVLFGPRMPKIPDHTTWRVQKKLLACSAISSERGAASGSPCVWEQEHAHANRSERLGLTLAVWHQFADYVHFQNLMGWAPDGTSVAVTPLSACISLARGFRAHSYDSFACLVRSRLSSSSSAAPCSKCVLRDRPTSRPRIQHSTPPPFTAYDLVAGADDFSHPFPVFLRALALFHDVKSNRPSARSRPDGTSPPEFRARTPRSSFTPMSRPPLIGVRPLRYGLCVAQGRHAEHGPVRNVCPTRRVFRVSFPFPVPGNGCLSGNSLVECRLARSVLRWDRCPTAMTPSKDLGVAVLSAASTRVTGFFTSFSANP